MRRLEATSRKWYREGDSKDSIQEEWIRQVFFDKGHESFITFDEIGAYKVAIVIPITIEFPKDQIGSMTRHC